MMLSSCCKPFLQFVRGKRTKREKHMTMQLVWLISCIPHLRFSSTLPQVFEGDGGIYRVKVSSSVRFDRGFVFFQSISAKRVDRLSRI